MHFIELLTAFNLNHQSSPDTILVTLDVSALYTNIPHAEGIQAVRQMMRTHRTWVRGDLHANTIATLLRMVLEFNNFEFNGQHYLQVGGTAMGTRVAPTFANLFMAHMEQLHVYPYPLQPSLWLRFIDDIFMIWDHSQTELQNFHQHLNHAHPNINFTMEASHHRVHFLDMWVIKEQTTIITTLYIKPTDSNNLLHFHSAHPYHCRAGIPYGQFLRIRRICTRLQHYVEHGIIKIKQFLERGYPRQMVIHSFLRAALLDRGTLLHKKNHQDLPQPSLEQQILVTTFNPAFKGLQPIVTANWPILSSSHKTQYLYDKALVTGLRKPSSLRDLVVRARTDYHTHQTPLTQTDQQRTYNVCNTTNCRYCTRLDTTGTIISNTTKRSYKTRTNVSCKSSNLIYAIQCTRCGHQYVGQTERKLMNRISEHFTKVTHGRTHTDMGKHFCTPPHQGIQDIKLFVLDFIHCHPQSDTAAQLRDKIESHWIHRLRCLAPLGMNLMDTPRYRKRRDSV